MTRIFGMLDINKKRLARSVSDRYGGRPISLCVGMQADCGSMLVRAATRLKAV
jgi:hypothetical protein